MLRSLFLCVCVSLYVCALRAHASVEMCAYLCVTHVHACACVRVCVHVMHRCCFSCVCVCVCVCVIYTLYIYDFQLLLKSYTLDGGNMVGQRGGGSLQDVPADLLQEGLGGGGGTGGGAVLGGAGVGEREGDEGVNSQTLRGREEAREEGALESSRLADAQYSRDMLSLAIQGEGVCWGGGKGMLNCSVTTAKW